MNRLKAVVGAAAVASLATLCGAPAAFAAGPVYPPTAAAGVTVTVVVPGTPVTTTLTIGATVTVSVGGSTPIQIGIGDASGQATPVPGLGAVALALNISVYDTNGKKITGPLANPVTVTVNDPNIKAGDVVVINGAQVPATVSDGVATFTITSDPIVEILAQAAPATAPAGSGSATGTPATPSAGGSTPAPATAPGGGLAFTGADIAATVGVGAAALGIGGLLVLTSRRRKAAASKS